MDGTYLIEKNYDRNRRAAIKLTRKGEVLLCYQSKNFGSREVLNLLSDLKRVIKVYGRACKRIVIYIKKFAPKDKLVYTLVESTIYTLMNIYKYDVDLRMDEYEININTAGLNATALIELAKKGNDTKWFNKRFRSTFVQNHFRRVLSDIDDDTAVSMLVTDIKTFLYKFHMKDEFDKNLAMVVGELADNANDHAKTSCLVDIDITEADFKYKDIEDGKKYYAINIVVLNFGNKCLYDDIMEKIIKRYYHNSSRYDIVREAYNYHKAKFGKNYNEKDFFIITSFQDEISGRANESNTGGKGLPELVRTLEEFADEDYCYVLTGKNGLCFDKDVLNYTSDGWIGFNKNMNYKTSIPDADIFYRSDTYLPGTGYNFMLVFEGVDKDGRE